MATAREILERARGLIEQGWCKGEMERPREGGGWDYCAIGAGREAAALMGLTQSSEAGVARRCLIAACRNRLEDRFIGVSTYNDDPNTTKEDILSLYDEAIASLEAH